MKNIEKTLMDFAEFISQNSPDPHTKVGAVIANGSTIIGVGYNDFPDNTGKDFPLKRDYISPEEYWETKYPYILHAEPRAILEAINDINDSSVLYVNLFPCNECAKLIVQTGIKKIIYSNDKYNGTCSNTAAKRILDSANVYYIQLNTIDK